MTTETAIRPVERHASRNPRYDLLFEPLRIGPGHRAQPLLPGAALHRHGHRLPRQPAPPSRDQGRGRLGRRQYGILLHPSELRRRALSHGEPVGRAGHGPARGRRRRDPRAWRAGRGRALAWRHQDPQSRQPRSQPLALGRAQPLSLSPADPRHGQGRYPGLPALAGQCGAARQAGGLRHRLLLCRPWLSALPVHLAALEPAQRRIWRLHREPGPAAARDDRGDQGGRGRRLRGRGPPRHG